MCVRCWFAEVMDRSTAREGGGADSDPRPSSRPIGAEDCRLGGKLGLKQQS
jgi:hypothetical protein